MKLYNEFVLCVIVHILGTLSSFTRNRRKAGVEACSYPFEEGFLRSSYPMVRACRRDLVLGKLFLLFQQYTPA